MTAPAPLPLPSRRRPGPIDGDDWRQAELEALWFARIEHADALRQDNPTLSWARIADDHLRCGESTLRYWRRRYWQAHQAAS